MIQNYAYPILIVDSSSEAAESNSSSAANPTDMDIMTAGNFADSGGVDSFVSGVSDSVASLKDIVLTNINAVPIVLDPGVFKVMYSAGGEDMQYRVNRENSGAEPVISLMSFRSTITLETVAGVGKAAASAIIGVLLRQAQFTNTKARVSFFSDDLIVYRGYLSGMRRNVTRDGSDTLTINIEHAIYDVGTEKAIELKIADISDVVSRGAVNTGDDKYDGYNWYKVLSKDEWDNNQLPPQYYVNGTVNGQPIEIHSVGTADDYYEALSGNVSYNGFLLPIFPVGTVYNRSGYATTVVKNDGLYMGLIK